MNKFLTILNWVLLLCNGTIVYLHFAGILYFDYIWLNILALALSISAILITIGSNAYTKHLLKKQRELL